MKGNYILFFVLGLFLRVNAQNSTAHCQRLLKIADSIYFSLPDSAYTLSCLAEKCIGGNDKALEAKVYLNKARYLLLKSFLEEAEAELNKAYDLYSYYKDTLGLASSLKLKSILFQRLQNEKEAIKMQEMSYSLYKKKKQYKSVYSSLLNLSYIYTKNGFYDKAKKALDELDSLSFYRRGTDEYYYNQNKGDYEFSMKNYQIAENYFLKAWRYAKLKKMVDSEATILMYLGRNSRYRGDLKTAEKYLLESEVWSKKNKLEHELLEAYEEIVLLYQQCDNYKKAFEYQILKENLSKSLLNIEHINKVAALEKKLLINEKQKEINFEKEKTLEAKERAKLLVLWLSGIVVVLVLVAFLFIRTRKLKNKIHYKNLIIETKQKEILDSIYYAKKIQKAHLPSEQYISKKLGELTGKKEE